MLIEFSVANFLSFRERQTLSMVAAPQLRRRENTFLPIVSGEKIPPLLKVVALYGPNASGKSNLLKALECIGRLALLEPTANPTPLPVNPFRFDSALADQASKFEVHFIQLACRYSFEVHATAERITFEKLVAYPKGEAQLLYERVRFATGDAYKFGEDLEGERELHEVWRKATGPRVLFLAQAVANSSEEFTQLSSPLSWLRDAALFVSGNLKVTAQTSQRLMSTSENFTQSVQSLLSEIDVPITQITSKEIGEDGTAVEVSRHNVAVEKKRFKTTLTHSTMLGSADFDLAEESEGTQNLIGFWLPWYVTRSISQGDSYGQLLVVDELDASLHPNIIDALIRSHVAGQTSGQVIFTSHNTHLMDKKILRRDQFWLTERDENGATQLRSVHDFKGRDSEDIEKRYFEGKYRSLPHVTV